MSDNTHPNCGAAGGIGLVTVIIALVFLFVWPGPFRYEYRDWPAHGEGLTSFFHRDGPAPAGTKIDRISHQAWDYDFEEQKWVKR
jgi:hypothetical protein